MKEFKAPTTVRGLAFLPKGYRLAVTHYNGVFAVVSQCCGRSR